MDKKLHLGAEEFTSEEPAIPDEKASKADISKALAEKREQKKRYARSLYEFLYVLKEESVYFPWRRKKEIEDSGETNPDYEKYKKSKLRDLTLTNLCAYVEEIALGHITIKSTDSEEKRKKILAQSTDLLDRAEDLRAEIKHNKEIFAIRESDSTHIDQKKLEYIPGLVGKPQREQAAYLLRMKQEQISRCFPEISFGKKFFDRVPMEKVLQKFGWMRKDTDEEGLAIRFERRVDEIADVFPFECAEIFEEQDRFLKPLFEKLAAHDKAGNALGYIDNHRYIKTAETLTKDTLRAMYTELEYTDDKDLQDALEWKLLPRKRR